MTDPKELGPYEALEALREHAEAGRSNAWLAKKADVSIRQVEIWRKRVGLDPPRGPVREQAQALRGLVAKYDPARHRTEAHLDFESPVFVLREALDYTEYARACFALQTVARFSTAQIARATGTRASDVDLALQAWRRHLSKKGRRCLGCDTLLDPRFGEFCSRTCYDHQAK